jgi:hypothetical protein
MSKLTVYRGSETRTVATKFDNPPVPFRGWDWSAWIEEELDLGSMVGRGETEMDAITDLLEQMDERVEVPVRLA